MRQYPLPEKKEKKPIIDKKIATDFFIAMTERWEINVYDFADDAEEKVNADHCDRVINGIECGIVTMSDENLPVVKTNIGEVCFQAPGGQLTAMDSRKANALVGKTYASIASWGKIPPSDYAKILPARKKICESLFLLFFGLV